MVYEIVPEYTWVGKIIPPKKPFNQPSGPFFFMEPPGAQVELPGFTTASAPLWGTAPDFMATLDAGVGIERWKKCWKHLGLEND